MAEEIFQQVTNCSKQEARQWFKHIQKCPQVWLTQDALSIVAAIDLAFGDIPKPAHFTDHTHCPECADHDQNLRSHQRESIPRDALGCPGYDPITFCSPDGVAYYMPALVRYALAPSHFDDREWYGEQLLYFLGNDSNTVRHFNPQQKQALLAVVHFLQSSPDWVTTMSGSSHQVDLCMAEQALISTL
ncbi:hypothetical protein E9531_01180 [Lampropedia puyangensis]|uniref:Uncharacterized protein n=1 Tax=Lampropedia puyangensis TaxID=1330072 RepID=A0A4S8FC33_9BURK|nr:DUF6714 family protein [Lampropedia puyangensis]THU05198.1 hypothetical protein E9531_01180 [Lampropedia puyangensis]